MRDFLRTARTASFCVLASLSGVSTALADTDYFSTGPGTGSPDTLCDVWQGLYNGWGLSPTGDEDFDGATNYVESVAGTDPRNPNDAIKVGNTTIVGNTVTFTFDAEKGKRYRILSDASSPTGAFATVETQLLPVNGATQLIPTSGNPAQTITITKSGAAKFYRLETTEADSDGDGVSDWAEGQLGMNPAVASSTGNGASDGETLHSLLSLTVESTSDGYEKEDRTATTPVPTPGKLRLVRTYGTMALNGIGMIGSAGATNSTKASASAADYAALGNVNIPAGAAVPGNPYEVSIMPVQDSTDEVPEALKVTLSLPGAANVSGPSGTLNIGDSNPENASNAQLYVAYLGREAGVTSTASGYATALVNGDNTSASIAVTFNNLSSEQNTAYIRLGPNNDLAPALPNGQVSGVAYQIEYKPGLLATDQSFLTALAAGQLGCAISSANYSDREIFGYFNKASGTTTFDSSRPDLVMPTGSWQNPTGAALEREIWRFLSQCTWGGTQALYDEVLAEVNAAVGGGGNYIQGLSNWLDKQMNPALTPSINLRTLVMSEDNEDFMLRGNKPSTYNSDPQINGSTYAVTYDAAGNPTIGTTADTNRIGNNYPQSGPNRRRAWWSMILQSKDQVRQRYTQALSEITIISEADQTILDRHLGCANYWDMLAENAFGKYRALLEKVTYSPMMGIYLSHMSNRQYYEASPGLFVSPDENYAREIMQLFSIGLILRHPDGSLVINNDGLPIATYDNNDITELARVMTGWSHGAQHAVGYLSTWSGTNLTFNNASAQRISDLVLLNGASTTHSWFGRTINGSSTDGHLYWAAPWMYPMKLIGRLSPPTPGHTTAVTYHDFGVKTLLSGKAGEATIPAQDISAMTDAQTHAAAMTDMTLAHNALAGDPASDTSYNGHPNTPVNMSRWLIQRLVTSNPSAGYIYRVQKVYCETNGNLGSVLKAILLDYEARSLELADTSISHGKVKEPIVAFANMLRTLRAFSGAPISSLKDNPPPFSGSDTPQPGGYPQGEFDKFSTANVNPPSLPNGWAQGPFRFRFGDTTGNIGQSPQRPPSVFNWFLPDFVVPGPMALAGLYAPELQISTESSEVAKTNFFYAYTWSNLTGMNAQPGSDSNISDFLLNNALATPSVRFSLDGGQTFVNSLTFTAANWSTPQTITVVGANTGVLSSLDNSLLRFNITGTGSGYEGVTAQPVSISVAEDERPNEGILALHSNFITWVQEGGKTDTVTVRLASPPTPGSTVDVDVTVTNAQVLVNSSGGSPAASANLSFTSANWNTDQVVTVTAVVDSVAEAPGSAGASDTLTFTSTSSVGAYNGLVATVPVGITDSSTGTNAFDVLITETGGSTAVTETGSTGVSAGIVDSYTIVLTKQPSADVIVTCTPSNTQIALNNSTGGTSYQTSPVSRTFTNANWNTPQEVRVRGNDDGSREGSYPTNPLHTGTILHSINTASGGYAITTALQRLPVTVTDNDMRIILSHTGGETRVSEDGSVTDTITVALRVAPTVPVTVNLGSNSVKCSPTNLIFTPGNFATPQVVTVTAVDDAVKEGIQTPLFPPLLPPTNSTATSTISAGAVTSVTLTNPGVGYAGVPTVTFGASPGVTATGFATVSPTTGSLTGITVTNPGSGYVSAPAVTIGAAQNPPALITASATSEGIADTNYNNEWGNTPTGTFTQLYVTVLDNDASGVVITHSGGSTITSESGVSDDFTVALAQRPTADVTITFTPGTQVTLSGAGLVNNTLTFTPANWSDGQVLTVTGVNDTTVEGDAVTSVGMVVASADKAYDGVRARPIPITVIDNDLVPLTITHTNVFTGVSEAGTSGTGGTPNISDTFTVALPKTPTGNVSVTLIPDGQVTVSPPSLTFTPTNSTTTQTVTVTAVDDLVSEFTPQNSVLRFGISSTDPFYNNPAHAPVMIPVKDNDGPGFSIVESSGNTTPTEGGTDSYTVVLTKQPPSGQVVVIDVTSPSPADLLVNSSAITTPATSVPLTFTNANWSTAQTVTVTAVADMITEGREVVNITNTINPASTTDNTYDALPAQTVISYITDQHRRNESIVVIPSGGSIRSNDALPTGGNTYVAEGDPATDTVDFYLSTPPQIPVTVALSANAQMGFNQSVFYFTPENWNVPQTVVVSAIDDIVNDTYAVINNTLTQVAQSQNITFTCTAGDPAFFNASATSAVNILDNESPAVKISQTGGITTTTEGGATDSYEVVLTKEPNGNVVVTATPASGSTINGSTSAINLTFTTANWYVPQTVTVLATNDTSQEGAHQSNITHTINVAATTDTSGYRYVLTNAVTTLNSTSVTCDSTVGLAAGMVVTGTGINAGTTIASISTANTTTFTLSANASQSNTGLTLTTNIVGIQTVVNNITDNDNRVILTPTLTDTRVQEDGSVSDTYSVVLRSQPSANVTITPSITGGAAAQGLSLSPSSITFTGGAGGNWATPQTFTLSGVDNGNNAERARTVSITHAATSSDTNFNGSTNAPVHSVLASVLAKDSARVLLMDNPSLNENGNTGSYRMALSRAPTADVSIALAADAQVQAAPPILPGGALIYGSNTQLTFTSANWMNFQTVTLRPVDDLIFESTPHVGLVTQTATSADAVYDNAPAGTALATITDNEVAAVRIIPSGGSTILSEAGQTDTYDIVLSNAPAADVTVNISHDAQISSVSPTSVTFNTGDWSTPRTVTITANNDGAVENTHSGVVTHSAAISTDPVFSGVLVPTVTASIIDNDGAQLVVNQSDGSTSVVEGGTNDTIQISLSQAPSANVTVTLIPPMSIIPVPPYAKQFGYYTTDLSGSNQNRERVVVDYTEVILLYRSTFYGSLATAYSGSGNIPAVPSDVNLQNAHWAATKAIIDKMDLWWCQGSLKARYPDSILIEPNLPPPVSPPSNPRQAILDCIYQINGAANSPGTTRYLPEVVFDPKSPPTGTFHDEIRDRARWAGYLMTTAMPGFVSH